MEEQGVFRMMIRRIFCLLAVFVLVLSTVPALASGFGSFLDGISLAPSDNTGTGSALLSRLTHNCTNTGIMLPEKFDPMQTTYLLTVASWVSRPTFTPTAYDPNAVITVNGKVVRSGAKSQVIEMTDEPQAVTIQVTNGSISTVYTIFLQRRPSEKRTRISAGYITKIYQKNSDWRIDADLATLKYKGTDYQNGNLSTIRNAGKDSYDYVVDPNCILYYGTKQTPIRAINIEEFKNNYNLYGDTLYTIIYIESEIVAVLPYGADY